MVSHVFHFIQDIGATCQYVTGEEPLILQSFLFQHGFKFFDANPGVLIIIRIMFNLTLCSKKK